MTTDDRMEEVMAGDDSPTVCAECRHLFVINPKDQWYRWACMAAPRPKWFNPVTGIVSADPPYALCKGLNNGNCEMYEPGINSLSPHKLIDNRNGTFTRGEE